MIAHAHVATPPEFRPHPAVRESERYPWVFSVADEVPYLNDPMVIDADLRSQLEVFQGKDPNKGLVVVRTGDP